MKSSKIQLITDSTTSLSLHECDTQDIVCLETTYTLNDELHYAFDDEKVSLPEFYEKLEKVKSCSTGCINVQTFEDEFGKQAEAGNQVLYVGLSASLSSTFANSEIAARNINEKYGKKMIAVVDSRSASFGTVAILDEAKDLILKGLGLEEIEKKLDLYAKNMSVAFVAKDLSFMYHSGRISMLEAGLGKLLHIVPIISVSESGKLKVSDKCLGQKLAFKTLKNKFVNLIKSKGYKRCYISSCNLPDEVENLKNYIETNTDIKQFKTGLIDKTLACCCGPKTIAIFCG